MSSEAITADRLSYPTASKDFLDHLENGVDSSAQPSPVQLNVLIGGAGLGGLATAIALSRRGHRVTILEQAPQLGEEVNRLNNSQIGAGIQVPSNSSRILCRWGIDRHWADHVVRPHNIYLRRWQTGETIGKTALDAFEDEFGASYYVIHRAHLHDAMHHLLMDLGVEVITNSKIIEWDPETPSVKLEDGRVYTADLIIAADGIKSTARQVILGGKEVSPVNTGFAAYRATVRVEDMLRDPETATLVQTPNLHLWLGHNRHAMTYTIAGSQTYNMVLSHVDHTNPATWSTSNPAQILDDMRAHYADWDPRLVKVISMIKTVQKWPLLSGSKLSRWIHPAGKLIMIGDAAHAMLPYMSEGAAMAVEDGAALAEALHYTRSSDIGPALALWEKVRIERSSQMQQASFFNGKIWHFADGPEQRARDLAARAECEDRHFIASSNQWSDPTTQRWCYGYDAESAIRKAMAGV